MIVMDNECERLGCTEIVGDGKAYCDGCEACKRSPEMNHLEDLLCPFILPIQMSPFVISDLYRLHLSTLMFVHDRKIAFFSLFLCGCK